MENWELEIIKELREMNSHLVTLNFTLAELVKIAPGIASNPLLKLLGGRK